MSIYFNKLDDFILIIGIPLANIAISKLPNFRLSQLISVLGLSILRLILSFFCFASYIPIIILSLVLNYLCASISYKLAAERMLFLFNRASLPKLCRPCLCRCAVAVQLSPPWSGRCSAPSYRHHRASSAWGEGDFRNVQRILHANCLQNIHHPGSDRYFRTHFGAVYVHIHLQGFAHHVVEADVLFTSPSVRDFTHDTIHENETFIFIFPEWNSSIFPYITLQI